VSEHPKHLLNSYGLTPKKSLGQNFLFDDNILARIAGAADLAPRETVLEIGPGLGALTRQLAARAARVVAVELDDRLLPALRHELAGLENVVVVHGDILAHDPADLISGPYVVVANVPYYITGAILRHLLGGAHKPSRLVLTVQNEVAERLTAEPPHMSLLAVSVRYYGAVTPVTVVKAGAFWPRPDVDSAIIRIDLYEHPQDNAAAEDAFFRLVRAGFSQKRKQLQKNLRQLGLSRAAIARALSEANIEGSRRAETLLLAEWHALAEALAQAGGSDH